MYSPYDKEQPEVRIVQKPQGSGTRLEAEAALLRFAEKWNDKYPTIYALWERNWANIVTIFGYPAEIRKEVYTTNAIASLRGD